MEFHNFAHLFPMMGTTDHAALVEDIRTNGLLHPLTLHDGKILDGRNRFQACAEAGVEPRYEDLPANVDPLTFVVSTNFTRRHLSESQRALAAARIESHGVKREAAGKMFKVRGAGLRQAEKLLKNGTAELIEAVENDSIPVNIASKLSIMPEDAQLEACTMKPKELRGVVKRQARIKKSVALAKATKLASEKLGTTLYGVLYADPPWRWESWSGNGMDRAADNHYPTETTATIAAMAVPAAENAVLFLWATNPMLEDALAVMKAWGFTYKTNFAWGKDKAGTGFWNRSKHELLLVGTRGDIPAPDPTDRCDSLIEAPVGEHSVKPAQIRELIEGWFPTLPKIELFAREYHPGWDSHGAELPAQDEATGIDEGTQPVAE